jgi:hypothetical protein
LAFSVKNFFDYKSYEENNGGNNDSCDKKFHLVKFPIKPLRFQIVFDYRKKGILDTGPISLLLGAFKPI